MTNLVSALCESAAAAADFGVTASEIAALENSVLLAGMAAGMELAQRVETHNARYAAEIAIRSHKDLGNAGLARLEGFANTESLLQGRSGSSWQDAAKLVKIGTMMADVDLAAQVEAARLAAADATEAARVAALETDSEPEPVPVDPILLLPVSPDALWQAPITAALTGRTISTEQANSIRNGLGRVTSAVSAQMLLGAVLILLSGRDTSAQLFKRARQMRDSMDSDGVKRGEVDRRSLRFVKAHRKANGMVAGSYAFADADAALWWETFQQATAPRQGGPRATDTDQAARDGDVLEDARTTDQIAADYFINLLQVGIGADPGTILGNKHPAVRIIVEEAVLTARQADATDEGIGRIEGMTDAVTLATVEQALCNTGFVGIKFDDSGKCLDLGRTQRLFTQRQRIALAVRDGGCRAPGCDRPPSWCEAHHIDFWDRDHGTTDIDQGVLLCRFHHQLFHGTGWEITRSGSHYFLIPPKNLDSFQRPILMPSKTQAIRAMTDPALHALLARTRPRAIDPPAAPTGDSYPAPLGTTIIPMTPTPAGPGENAVRFVWSDTLWDDEPVPEPDG